MAQGVALTTEQVRVIREVWIATTNGSAAASAAGCSARTAQSYVAANRDDLLALRAQKKGTSLLAEAFQFAASTLLGEALSPHKLASATTKDLMTSAAIAVDKFQLMTGQATARTETITDPSARLTPDEMEAAGKIRAKLAAEAVT